MRPCGNPGVGKTFLAEIVARNASKTNQRVLFTTAMDMVNHLLASQVDHSLITRLKIYTEPRLLVCDELGYLSLDHENRIMNLNAASLMLVVHITPQNHKGRRISSIQRPQIWCGEGDLNPTRLLPLAPQSTLHCFAVFPSRSFL